MSNKIIGILLIGFAIGILLGGAGSIGNNWPIQKILFVLGVQFLIALVPLIIGIKKINSIPQKREDSK